MKTIFKAFCIIAILGLALGFISPVKPVSADDTGCVSKRLYLFIHPGSD